MFLSLSCVHFLEGELVSSGGEPSGTTVEKNDEDIVPAGPLSAIYNGNDDGTDDDVIVVSSNFANVDRFLAGPSNVNRENPASVPIEPDTEYDSEV